MSRWRLPFGTSEGRHEFPAAIRWTQNVMVRRRRSSGLEVEGQRKSVEEVVGQKSRATKKALHREGLVTIEVVRVLPAIDQFIESIVFFNMSQRRCAKRTICSVRELALPIEWWSFSYPAGASVRSLLWSAAVSRSKIPPSVPLAWSLSLPARKAGRGTSHHRQLREPYFPCCGGNCSHRPAAS